MPPTDKPHGLAPRGLADLAHVGLTPEQDAGLERACATSLGSPAWRVRKRVEARDLLALSRIAPRLTVLALELSTELHARIRLDVSVPCLRPATEELVVEPAAELAVRYPEALLRQPLPGTALVRILAPSCVWHPNISFDLALPQAICLGDRVPRSLPLNEIVLACYQALSLQAITLDERDPAGILNLRATHWWQHHTDRIPLSAAPFLTPAGEGEGGMA